MGDDYVCSGWAQVSQIFDTWNPSNPGPSEFDDLAHAKRVCEEGCDARDDCFSAVLEYVDSQNTACNVYDGNCADGYEYYSQGNYIYIPEATSVETPAPVTTEPKKFAKFDELSAWCDENDTNCRACTKEYTYGKYYYDLNKCGIGWQMFEKKQKLLRRCAHYRDYSVCERLPGCKEVTKTHKNNKTKTRCKGRMDKLPN